MANRPFCAAFALAAVTAALRADVPPGPSPRPSPPQLDRGADGLLPPLPARFARTQQARTRDVFRFDRPDAQAHVRFPSTPTRDLPSDARSGTACSACLAPWHSSPITAGLALTLAIVAAGLWLTRARNAGS
jgi:hypothetical protein